MTTPIEPLHIRRRSPRDVKVRARKRLVLPPEARRFVRRRRDARYIVRALHRWLVRRRLKISDLTADLLCRFLERPRGKRVAAQTSYSYWNLLRPYLERLYDGELIAIDPDRLRRHPKRLPVAAHEFIASLAPTHRPSTCRGYTVTLRRFHAWLDQHDLAVDQLTRPDIVRWFQQLHDAGLQPSTRTHLLQHVRSYLEWLAERRSLRTAPNDLVRSRDMPKLPRYLPRPLTLDADRELQRRLETSGDPAAIGLLVMRRTGMRIGELQSLEYHCLRPHERTPLLKVPLGKMNSERLVPIDGKTVELIRRLQALRPRPRPWLLPTRDGERMSCARLFAALEKASRGLPEPSRVTSHRLRHTYATEMLSAGMSLLGVMRLLGHRDFRMTLRYTAITPETVGAEYHKALEKLATKYHLPDPPTTSAPPESPDQMLDHLSRWLQKQAPSRRGLRSLLKRIERLQVALRTMAATTKP